jgi:hypothetical protein
LLDWAVERGIGEDRFVRIVDGRITDARIRIEGTPSAGEVLTARLTSVRPQTIARVDGLDFLLPGGAGGQSEGAAVSIEVTREPIPGAEPWKRPLARLVDGPAAAVTARVSSIPFPAPDDPLGAAGWSDLIVEARSGLVDFAGGQLRVSLTPAMTLIDVDGHLPAEALAKAAAAAAADTIRRHCIGGSIGIDFPTVTGKAARQAVDEAIDAILPKPFERTAVNGFGFLQIVRPRRHPSLFELAADRAAFEARVLLRAAARHVGAVTLAANPAVIAAILPDWTERLARQIGGGVALRADPSLPMSGGHAH